MKAARILVFALLLLLTCGIIYAEKPIATHEEELEPSPIYEEDTEEFSIIDLKPANPNGNTTNSRKLRIFQGNPLDSSIVRHMANLILSDRVRCTGVLVTDTVVLTAAHCFYTGGRFASLFPLTRFSYALVGAPTTDSNAMAYRYGIRAAYVHSGYINTTTGFITGVDDIAVVILDSSVQYWQAEPVQIAAAPPIGTVVFPSGYGFNNFGDPNPVPEFASMKTEECTGLSNDLTLCYGSNTQSTCAGDSGGPVFANYDRKLYVVAIINGRYKNSEPTSCGPNSTGRSARLTSYFSWIINVLNLDFSQALSVLIMQ